MIGEQYPRDPADAIDLERFEVSCIRCRALISGAGVNDHQTAQRLFRNLVVHQAGRRCAGEVEFRRIDAEIKAFLARSAES